MPTNIEEQLVQTCEMGKPDLVQQTVKTAFAVYLFQEQAISLGKAIELSGMSRLQFIELLQTHGIAVYEYTEHDFEVVDSVLKKQGIKAVGVKI